MSEDKFKKLQEAAFDLNGSLPMDVWLKGDGRIWVCTPNHPTGRAATQQEVIEHLFNAIQTSGRMVSI